MHVQCMKKNYNNNIFTKAYINHMFWILINICVNHWQNVFISSYYKKKEYNVLVTKLLFERRKAQNCTSYTQKKGATKSLNIVRIKIIKNSMEQLNQTLLLVSSCCFIFLGLFQFITTDFFLDWLALTLNSLPSLCNFTL